MARPTATVVPTCHQTGPAIDRRRRWIITGRASRRGAAGRGHLIGNCIQIAPRWVTRAGEQNLFGTSAETFPNLSIEDLSAAKPAVWITDNYQPGPTADDKANLLFRTFPDAPASQNRRVVAIDNVDVSAGIHNVATVDKLARAFFPEEFD